MYFYLSTSVFTSRLDTFYWYFYPNQKVTIPKTLTLTLCNLLHLPKHHRDQQSSIIRWYCYHPLLRARAQSKSELKHRLLKLLMSNSPSRSDNIIDQLLVKSELGKSTPQDYWTRRITSGNLMVNQGKSPSSTPPP